MRHSSEEVVASEAEHQEESSTPFLYKELTQAIIGAAMEVHRVLGPGFLEAVYAAALAQEFGLRSIPHQREPELSVVYKGIVAGSYRADFVADGKVIVEIKAAKQLAAIDEAQLLNYLKATGYRIGLLLNFGARSLEIKRRIM